MNPRENTTLKKISGGVMGLLTVLAILVSINVIFNNIRLRIDCTEEKVYSLSEGTKATLKKLDQPITLKLYFSKSNSRVPVYLKNYASQVEDLLGEYRIYGNGMITIEMHDPKPDTDAEEWAQRYGVAGQALDMLGSPFYFGLAASSGGVDAVIPSIAPSGEQLLEYNITRLIHRLSNPEKPTVGVMSTLPVMGEPNQFRAPGQPQPAAPWIAFQELKNDFNIVNIDPEHPRIEKSLKTLILVHPKDLSDDALYAIDQFVLGGGHLVALVDPFCNVDTPPENMQGMRGMPHNNSSNLDKLLSSWGIGFDNQKIIADMPSASRVSMGNRVEESPIWLTLRKKNISEDDIITSQLEVLMMPFAGSFIDNTTDDIQFSPLVTSSDGGVLAGTMAARYGGPASLRTAFLQQGSAQNIAVRLTGRFTTAFPEGKPESKDEESEETEKTLDDDFLKEGESAVVLIGDVDMLFNQFCVREVNIFGNRAQQPFNDNLNFFANTVEQMAGNSDLISIRSRGKFNRPFDKVMALEAKARRTWQRREEELQGRLNAAQQKLAALQSQKDENQKFILSPAQKAEIENFKSESHRIQKELREVRKNLRKDIEELGVKLKVINIAIIPIVLCITGIGYGALRRKKK